MNKITFSPVTRLSGLLSVEIMVEGQTIIDARVKGNQFRGFEWMLRDRDIRDATYFTQRICGICSMAHGFASSRLLDTLFNDDVPPNAKLLRQIMLGLEFLQNHIRHFYAFGLPDYIKLPQSLPYQGEVVDRRFSPAVNENLVQSYLQAFKIPALAHEALALFGGKAPHQHSMVHGGVAVTPTPDKIMHAQSIVTIIRDFIENHLIPDTDLISQYYSDYFHIGRGTQNYLSFGLFQESPASGSWPPGIIINGQITDQIDVAEIKEDIVNSWYVAERETGLDPTALPTPAPTKEGAYTFVKAVHYQGVPCEVGPLARLYISRQQSKVASTMDRIMARSLETSTIAKLVQTWLGQLDPSQPYLNQTQTPSKNQAISMVDVPRGALLHTATIEGLTIQEYGIITPTVWNFSPQNQLGFHGPVETALIGTRIKDLEHPEEIGRIIRAFDPCLSCATHVIRV